MHRLAVFQQQVVGDVDNSVDGTNTATAQLFLHPERALGVQVQPLDDAAEITGAIGWRFNPDREGRINSGNSWRPGRLDHVHAVEHADFTGQTRDAEAIGTVRGQIHIDADVVEREVFTDIGPDGGIQRQLDDAIGFDVDAQLAEGAEHAVGRLAAQLGFLDGEITRQGRPDLGHAHFEAGAAVRRTADDVQQLFFAHVDLGHPQLVGVRVLGALDHFTHHHIVELAGHRFHGVHFQTGHGDLLGQRIVTQLGADPLHHPGFTEFHVLSPLLELLEEAQVVFEEGT